MARSSYGHPKLEQKQFSGSPPRTANQKSIMQPRVLIVDDKESVVRMLRDALTPNCEVTTETDGLRAIALALRTEFDVVISDIRMPAIDGFELLTRLKEARPDIEVILMTAFGTVQRAVAAMKAGAYDYLSKPFEPDEALLVVERAAERRRLRLEASNLRAALQASRTFENLCGRSPEMLRVLGLLAKASNSDVNVLITGERGTGKRVAARGIHRASARSDGSLSIVNCSANPAELSEGLFAQRDAVEVQSSGQMTSPSAAPGTVLLENVDELPMPLQARLCLWLQQRPRAADPEPSPLRPRIVATSANDVKALLKSGALREDLLYQLNVFNIHLPALRDRKDDIPLLAASFIEQHGKAYQSRVEGFTPEALSALVQYSWPGNVRELENAVERALAVVDEARIPLEALPDEVRGAGPGRSFSGLAQLTYREALEQARERACREYLVALMQEFSGSVTRAAERAGIERESLHRLLKRYGVRSNEFRGD
ncbi:MAG TPA: sigma-54 dependent transcriptional regulator [Polyangiaceae bacterium]|nr:sigma-54 dependent transcriptional regulator [Polyangiaceae bacterium]